MKRLLTLAACAAIGLSATPAFADGDVRCAAGPKDKWQPIAKLKKKAWLEGWKIAKVQIEGDCYEMYAHTAEGQAVEAFFHPVTLQKLIVFRRGKEVYRAPGFAP
jgi:hypothetical protein